MMLKCQQCGGVGEHQLRIGDGNVVLLLLARRKEVIVGLGDVHCHYGWTVGGGVLEFDASGLPHSPSPHCDGEVQHLADMDCAKQVWLGGGTARDIAGACTGGSSSCSAIR